LVNLNKSLLKFLIFFLFLLSFSFYLLTSNKNEVLIVGPNFYQQHYFVEELNYISDKTGIKIVYKAVNDVDYYLKFGDNNADIVILTDSKSVKEFGNNNTLVDISKLIKKDSYLYENNYLLRQVSSNDGEKIYGYWFRMYNNSMIWFNSNKNTEIDNKEFKNFDEILDFTSENSSITINPWCLSVHSGENQNLLDYETGESSGWIVSNWLENLILSEHGQIFYDLYSNNEVNFSKNEILLSMLDIKKITDNDNFVYGGKDYILKNTVSQSAKNLIDDDKNCFLSWIGFDFLRYVTFENINFENINYLKFPSEVNPDMVVGFGDIFGLLNDKVNSQIVFKNLVSDEFGIIWASKNDSLFVSSNPYFDTNVYTNTLIQKMFIDMKKSIINNEFRIDASMLMNNGTGRKITWTSLRKLILISKEEILDLAEEIDKRIKRELGS